MLLCTNVERKRGGYDRCGRKIERNKGKLIREHKSKDAISSTFTSNQDIPELTSRKIPQLVLVQRVVVSYNFLFSSQINVNRKSFSRTVTYCLKIPEERRTERRIENNKLRAAKVINRFRILCAARNTSRGKSLKTYDFESMVILDVETSSFFQIQDFKESSSS